MTTQMSSVELSVLVPVYKEEKNIGRFLTRITPVLERVTSNYEIIFCMDPGPDRTEEIICEHAEKDPRIKLLSFSRRFGQPAATIAGIENCTGKACVVIDVDLQDPPELIEQMVAKWREGYDVVYAQRRSRTGETTIKKIISYGGYWLINYISEVKIPRNTGDFRLIDRKVMEVIRRLPESHGFLRGLVAFAGYKQAAIQFDRESRADGQSKYNPFTGSLKIGVNGIVAFSTKPLTLATLLGISASLFSFAVGFWYLLQKLFLNPEITPGLPTTVIMITFFGGLQLVCLGIIGEYIGRIYEEVRQRPKYIIARKVNI